MKTHGQLWMTDSWIKEERAEYPPRVMRNLAAQLELVKPPLEVIEAFARKYGEDEGVVTLLEDNGHPLSVEFHDEWVTGVGGDLWIDLTLGKYRLHLNEEYARLFHDFMTHDYCY